MEPNKAIEIMPDLNIFNSPSFLNALITFFKYEPSHDGGKPIFTQQGLFTFFKAFIMLFIAESYEISIKVLEFF
jgi:hypothetical protein